MNYTPTPIQTADVIVPKEILDILEILAENTHDHWAQSKLREGWKYGEELSMEFKTHPDLVPYQQLSEEKKDYDRVTSLEAIKVLVKMNFSIERKD